MIKKAFEKKGTYFYFLPEYSQAKKVIWDNIDNSGFRMLDHIPDSLIANKNTSELKIELVNGSVIQLIGADKFSKSGVGTNPIGVVFSEYSINSPDAWSYVRPILAVNKGWAVFNFTPRGMNHGFDILNIAKYNDDWFHQVLTVDDTNILTKEDIEQEKAEGMPQDLVDQEYYCKFIEGATQYFRNVEANIMPIKEPDRSHEYQLGVDLAKYQDWTVIAPFDLNTFQVHKLERFNQQEWPLQKARIEAAYERLGHPTIVIDSTGVGDPITDDLIDRGVRNIHSFKFTEESRRKLLQNLQMLLENNTIKIPNDPILIDELKSFQYVQHGKRLRAEVPSGLHDDTVMALALAVWQIPKNPRTPNTNSIKHLTRQSNAKQRVTVKNYI